MIYIVAMVLLMIWGFFISHASMPKYKVGDWLQEYKYREFPDQGMAPGYWQVIDINHDKYLLKFEGSIGDGTGAFEYSYVEYKFVKVERK